MAIIPPKWDDLSTCRFDAAAAPTDESSFEVHPCQVRFDRSCAERDRFGPYAFTTTYDPYDVGQDIHRVFSELALAWGDAVHVQLAANYESYDTASSVDPRIALRWDLNDVLALRASAAGARAAPGAVGIERHRGRGPGGQPGTGVRRLHPHREGPAVPARTDLVARAVTARPGAV